MAKLVEFRIYRGKMVCLTGLHIGTGKDVIEIGGVDATVVKHPLTQMPYVPGSSLKGRMRALLEKKDGKTHDRYPGDPCGCGRRGCRICLIFGAHKNPSSTVAPTRLIVRDALLSSETYEEFQRYLKEAGKNYLEFKSENLVRRDTGVATNPRTFERVPEGAEFDVEFVLQVYEGDDVELLERTLNEGLALISQTYLGGSGSRGYGKVKFEMKPVEVVKA